MPRTSGEVVEEAVLVALGGLKCLVDIQPHSPRIHGGRKGRTNPDNSFRLQSRLDSGWLSDLGQSPPRQESPALVPVLGMLGTGPHNRR